MNTIEYLRDRLFRVLGFAKSTVGGTLTTVSPKDTYPVAIANELLGGYHVYNTLSELATAVPIARMQKGMKATINQHVDANGAIVKRATYVLENLPETNVDFISDIPNYDLSLYWKIDDNVDFEGASETQYAPNVDKVSGQAVVTGGAVPGFPGSAVGRKVTRAQYDGLVVGNQVSFNDGATPAIVDGYWSNTYDSTKGHVWMRQRLGSNSPWSNPIKVAGEGYSAGDYIENRFMWSISQPVTPPMYSNGKPNNQPTGWSDSIPVNPANGSKLWMIKCQKDSFQEVKTPWTPPIEIKIDGTLVRYSEKATPNPNEFGSDYTALAANGWLEAYNPNLHRYIARRETTLDQWVVDLISGESGEYIEYVFKVYASNLLDDILNNPDTYRPKDNIATGWTDVPVVPQASEIQVVSAAKKFSNGELKDRWSNPTPFGGQDTILDIIKSDSGDEFKKDKTGAINPGTIKLTASLYKGVTQVTPTSIQWTRIWNNGVLDTTSFGTIKDITLTPTDVTGLAIFRCIQNYDGNAYVSEYSVVDIADGIDSKALVTSANTNIVTIKGDGSKLPSSVTIRAFNSNLTGAIHWYKNGTKMLDGLGNPITTESISVDLSGVTNGSEITYKAEAQNDLLVDGVTKMFDETTIYGLAEASGGAPAVTMILSNESHIVVRNESTGATDLSTAKTDVRVFEGATDVTSTWTASIASTTGVTATIDNTNTARPIVSVDTMGGTVSQGSVSIKAVKGTNTIYKQFSIARIKDPIGAIILDIDSSNGGYTFTPTNQVAKTLTAKLYVDGSLVTTNVTYQWSFDGVNKGVAADQLIAPADVAYSTAVKCVATYNSKTYSRLVNVYDVKDARGLGILYTTNPVEILTSDQWPLSSWPYNHSGGLVGSTTWSTDSSGSIWMSTKKEGDTNWSTPVRIKGEKGLTGDVGHYMKNVFASASTKPAAPSGTNYTSNTANVVWTDTPPAKVSGKHIWMSQAEFNSSQTIEGVWSDPVQIDGTDGLQGIKGDKGDKGDTGPAGNTAGLSRYWYSGGGSSSWLSVNGRWLLVDTGDTTSKKLAISTWMDANGQDNVAYRMKILTNNSASLSGGNLVMQRNYKTNSNNWVTQFQMCAHVTTSARYIVFEIGQPDGHSAAKCAFFGLEVKRY